MPGRPHILGLSAYYHDSAAVLLEGNTIVAAAQEERFSRRKNDERFPAHAVDYCLRQSGLTASQLDAVVFYDKPITKFARLLESYLAVAPGGWRTFPKVLSGWLGEKLDLRGTIRAELPELPSTCPIWFSEHHQAHAASAFYPSPFNEAAILTIDGVGEWATTTVGRGRDHKLELLQELRFPHSLGLLYSAFTAYCGFRINSGEYKLMGLAPYGEPRYVEAIYRELLDLKEDGSFWLNLDYFHFLRGTTMTNRRFDQLFGGPPRAPDAALEERHADVARSIQVVTEEVMLRLARHVREVTGLPNLCLAGGVALNCVANGRILREKIFERMWIQPAAGDAGGALGAALVAWHTRWATEAGEISAERACTPSKSATAAAKPAAEGNYSEAREDSALTTSDQMQSALLGPAFSDEEIERVLQSHQAVYRRLGRDELLADTVWRLSTERVVGWFQGRMEFGPRALGNRSILGDPRSPKMQSVMNLKVKFRESFRPFAPVILLARLGEYFDLETESPYMLLVAPVKAELQRALPAGVKGLALLKEPRSSIPAVTHVDYSARIQTVTAAQNPLLAELLARWEQATGCPLLVNTSFNVRGEPIVCTPDDAYRCFVNTEMDDLVIGSFVLERTAQPRLGLPRPAELHPD